MATSPLSRVQPPSVMLLPGETISGYEEKLRAWLERRKVNLLSLQPDVERLFRLDFAALRALEVQLKRNYNDDSSIKDHSSDSEEDGEIREDVALNAAFHCKYCVLKVASRETVKNTEPERRQYEPIRSRQELLRTKVIPAHAFLQNEKYGPNGYMQCGSELDPIPIILRPGEFVESYERLFRKWLNYRNVIYEALQSDPEEERRYRQSYAYLRAWQQKQRWRFLENSSSWNSWDRNSSRDHGGGIKRKDRCSRNNRLRDLDFPWERNHYEKFESRERRRNGKRLRLNSAGSKGHVSPLVTTSEECSVTKQKRQQYTKDLDSPNRTSKTMTPDMESFNDGVINSTSSWNSSSTALSSPTPVCVELEKETGASGHEVAGSGAIFCKLEQPNRHALDKPPEHSEEDFNFVAVNVDTASEPGITSKHLDPTDVIQASVELVTKAEQVGLDPAKLRLIEDYIHFHDQIVVNEVAIEDLLAHIRATDTITEEESTENLSLIEEALVSVNEVKSKRALALAAIVGYDDETLPAQHFQLTQENSVSDSDSHERLTLMYSALKRKNDTLLVLQANVISQLDSVTNREPGGDRLLEGFQQLLSDLSEELTSISQMENQCHTASFGLL